MHSCAITRVRIRVENAIKKLKEYEVFTERLYSCINKQIVDDMMIIVCALCNLYPFVLREIPVLTEPALGHLCYKLAFKFLTLI